MIPGSKDRTNLSYEISDFQSIKTNLTNIFVFPSKDKRYLDNTRKSSQTESMIEMDCTQDPNKKSGKGRFKPKSKSKSD